MTLSVKNSGPIAGLFLQLLDKQRYLRHKSVRNFAFDDSRDFFKPKWSPLPTRDANNASVSYIVFNKKLWSRSSSLRSHECKMYGERNHKGRVCRRRAAPEKKSNFKGKLLTYWSRDSVERIDSVVSSRLVQFICKISCFFTSNRPNISINFSLINAFKPKLCPFLSIFITKAYLPLLEHYPGVLKLQIVMLLWHIVLLR